MKGQRLFIRRAEPADASALTELSSRHELPAVRQSDSVLVGKLVGDVAGAVAFETLPDACRIRWIVVEPDLRRKRVGRHLLDALAEEARKMERDWLEADGGAADGFFLACGFVKDREGRLRRSASRERRER